MKFNLIEDTNEEFNNPYNKQSHWEKHIKKNKEYEMTPDEYEKAAEILSETPCDYKKIFGYVAKDSETGKIVYVKYNKDTELFVSYYYKNNKPLTITAFKRSWRDFNGRMYDANGRYAYEDEIPSGM